MTDNNHPITPPDELVHQWINKHYACKLYREISGVERAIAYQSAHWSADQELEACDKSLRKIWQMDHVSTVDDFLRELRAARRPKPKSQVEEALDLLDRIEHNHMTKNLGNEKAWDIKELEAVRAALERLRELEKSNG